MALRSFSPLYATTVLSPSSLVHPVTVPIMLNLDTGVGWPSPNLTALLI